MGVYERNYPFISKTGRINLSNDDMHARIVMDFRGQDGKQV